jgi:aryl-alcohol dehydrogenase-like predicted oxidoreductase
MITNNRRRLGANGPTVSAIGLGCMGFSHAYGPADRRQASDTLHRALDLGLDLFDTADAYGVGHNEQLVGEVVRQRRDEVVLATKFGVRGVLGSPTATIDTSAAWVAQACDASLIRLGIDTVDLYYAQRRDPRVPVEETVAAMADLVTKGKIRWLGLCEVSPATLRAAHAVHPITAVQVEYSLFTRDVLEGELLATCRELGVAVVAYAPIGRGLLAGARDLVDGDQRRILPRFSSANLPQNLAFADEVARVAAEIGCTATQAALGWLLAQGNDLVAIPGTRTVTHLADNAAARDLTLSAEQLARLSTAVPVGRVAGDRYPPQAMAFLGH